MTGLLRYQIFMVYGFAFLATWQAALTHKTTIVEALGTVGIELSLGNIAVTYAPFWAISCIGIFAVMSIGYGVLTFEDCPEATAELDRQVKDTREELKKRGVKL
uniref:Dolichol-phosphate mannosyltransferase subunit 3 n=1 Tax=Odontella aurita TaxID=265563 RepID=A0A7S4JTX8_9STRA|mmetsp:Transcript_53863/g.161157  ORF Transcript_53863/g.161157 Transcript_53863/m.161157 type:complete len:104 (+) Transcript_53863:214-525(+)